MLCSPVAPDFAATGATLPSVVGAMLTIVLIAAVAALLAAAVSWALGEATGNHHLVGKAKTGLLIALGTAAAAGGVLAWFHPTCYAWPNNCRRVRV